MNLRVFKRPRIFFAAITALAMGTLMVGAVLAAETEDAILAAGVPVEEANFGEAVAISGDTAVVGAQFDLNVDEIGNESFGSVFVFVRDGESWEEQPKLIPSETGSEFPQSDFGANVAISGDTLVVGAPSDGNGSAFVFVRDDSGVWTEQDKLTPVETLPEGSFGRSVAISGDTIVVGGLFGEQVGENINNFGAAYVFVPVGDGTWDQQQRLRAPDVSNSIEFGISLALSGDTLVVGASEENPGGSAFVFILDDASGEWEEQDKLLAGDSSGGDEFGLSVAVDGDTAVVGAPFHEVEGTEAGAAYVFVRDGSGDWTKQEKLTPDDPVEETAFGLSVAVSGDAAVIGAPWGEGPGLAYTFVRSDGSWSQLAILEASDGADGDAFGVRVAISGNTAVVGANEHATDGEPFSGQAYVFELEIPTPPADVDSDDDGVVDDDDNCVDTPNFDQADLDGDGIGDVCDPDNEVLIDIKPGNGNATNPINPNSNGVIPVAILGTESFEISDVDVTTLIFAQGYTFGPVHEGHIEDVNGDGLDDLLLHFRTQESNIQDTDTTACIQGFTVNVIKIVGCDDIKIVGGGKDKGNK